MRRLRSNVMVDFPSQVLIVLLECRSSLWGCRFPLRPCWVTLRIVHTLRSVDHPSGVSPEYWFALQSVHPLLWSDDSPSGVLIPPPEGPFSNSFKPVSLFPHKNTNIFIWNQIRWRNRKLLSQLRRWMFFLKQIASGEDSFPFNMKTHGAAVPCPSFSPATLSSGERSTACQWPDPHTSLQVVSWSRLRAGWLSVLIYILAKCFSG